MPTEPSPAAVDARAAVAAALKDVPHVPGAPKPDPVLIADDVRRMFGGVNAVDVDHVEVQRGAITALIGPNGAGKTTFFNLLTGFDKPNSGKWTFDGRSLGGAATVFGPVLGSIIFWAGLMLIKTVMRDGVPETIMRNEQIEQFGWIIVGVTLMLLVIFRPQGILGDKKELAINVR